MRHREQLFVYRDELGFGERWFQYFSLLQRQISLCSNHGRRDLWFPALDAHLCSRGARDNFPTHKHSVVELRSDFHCDPWSDPKEEPLSVPAILGDRISIMPEVRGSGLDSFTKSRKLGPDPNRQRSKDQHVGKQAVASSGSCLAHCRHPCALARNAVPSPPVDHKLPSSDALTPTHGQTFLGPTRSSGPLCVSESLGLASPLGN